MKAIGLDIEILWGPANIPVGVETNVLSKIAGIPADYNMMASFLLFRL